MKGLLKIRLSVYYVLFLALFVSIELTVKKFKFDSGQLTLFSVNSFLYGFYLAPILAAQKSRIEELTKLVRNEAVALFTVRLKSRGLSEKERDAFKELESAYLLSCIVGNRVCTSERKYEAMISYCLDYKGKNADAAKAMLDILINNEQNRTQLSMQQSNIVFSHEWIVILVLFSITLTFVMLIDTGHHVVMQIIAAMLCTGLSMLLVILAKLSTLTHKKARRVWDPMKELLDSNFHRVF